MVITVQVCFIIHDICLYKLTPSKFFIIHICLKHNLLQVQVFYNPYVPGTQFYSKSKFFYNPYLHETQFYSKSKFFIIHICMKQKSTPSFFLQNFQFKYFIIHLNHMRLKFNNPVFFFICFSS